MFASAAPKSELAGEDVDRDGTEGKIFQARIEVGGDGFYGSSQAFDMSTEAHSIVASHGINCTPAACQCLDLGDVVIPKRTIANVKTCRIPVTTVATNEVSAWSWSVKGPIAEGAPVPNTLVFAGGQTSFMPIAMRSAACGQAPEVVITDANGQGTICIPYDGEFKASGYFAISASAPGDDGVTPSYWGDGDIAAGCPESLPIRMAFSGMASLTSFVSGEMPPRDAVDDGDNGQPTKKKKGCWVLGGKSSLALIFAPLLLGLGGTTGVRRRRFRG